MGHQGSERTYESLHHHHYWPKMVEEVKRYVRTCDSCQRIKALQQKPTGLLQPMLTPCAKWENVSMDFITHLLKTKSGKDTISVFIDMLSKMVHFVAMKMTDSALEV